MKYRILQTDEWYYPQVLIIDSFGSHWRYIRKYSSDNLYVSESSDAKANFEFEKEAKKCIDDYIEVSHRTTACGMQVKSIIDYDPGK